MKESKSEGLVEKMGVIECKVRTLFIPFACCCFSAFLLYETLLYFLYSDERQVHKFYFWLFDMIRKA